MFNLCNVLQLVIYRFYDGTFPKQQFVRHAHQSTFHVVFKFGDKLYAVHEQALEKVLADIAFVCDQLPVYEFNEGLVFQRFPVIHISRGYHEVEQLTLFVTNQMQLEVKEPSHGTLASLCNAPEHLVDMYPLVPAHSKGGEVWQSFFASRMLVCRSGKLLAGGSFRIGAVCVTSKNGNLMARKIQMKRFGN